MKFKEFLLEANKPINNEVDLIYQKILDNLDNNHVDFSPEKMTFNIGKSIKNSKYNNLDFVVRRGNKPNVRLGKDKKENSAIVIDTTGKVPDRSKIKKFLEHMGYSRKIKLMIKKYLGSHYDAEKETTAGTSYEKTKETNANFENNYEKLMKAVDKKIAHVHKARDYITSTYKKSADAGKQVLAGVAVKRLFTDEIGDDFNGFKSLVLKLPEAAFVKGLNPENKKKIMARLESYYEHKLDGVVEKDEEGEEKSSEKKAPAKKSD